MRIQNLVRVGQQYTHYLHMHHGIESSRLFPTLQEHGLDSAIVDRLVDEHDEIAVLIDQFTEGIRSAAAVEPAIVDSDLRRLSEALHAHLAYEESHVCPLLTKLKSWH
jgi:hemerythrin-like domain-containing protein